MKASTVIDGKKYDIPLDYSDISLAKFKLIQEYIDLHEDIKKHLLGEDVENKPTEDNLLKYYVGFISIATDIPKEIVMKINRYTIDDNIGIEDLFESFGWLYVMPEETNTPVNNIGRYWFIDKSGIMKDNSLVEYTEANTVTNALSKVAEGRYEYLNLLLGIFYRPRKLKWFGYKIEDYDADKVTKRVKEFDKLKMDVVFDCLFFFIQSRKNFLKSTEESLAVALEKEVSLVKD
jgi:hypothetical protein